MGLGLRMHEPAAAAIFAVAALLEVGAYLGLVVARQVAPPSQLFGAVGKRALQ